MEHHAGFLILVAVVLALFSGAILRHILKKVAIPYTVSLLVIGLGLGLMKRGGVFDSHLHILGESIELVASIDPHLIMFLFLPTLIFESAFALEGHLFKRAFAQIAILAVPGLIVCTVLTAFLIKIFFPWEWSWAAALLFGALISATDPVAVVALLKELSSRKRLETLIEGESLLNDGTAIVFFVLFLGFVTGEQGEMSSGLIPVIAWNFVLKVSLGVIAGLLFGALAIVFIGRVFKDAMIEITISVVVAYLTYIVAEEILHVSGVVAVVTLALLLASVGKTRISPEIEGFLHHFWEMMAYIANTLIFLLVGIIIALRVNFWAPEAWGALGLLFIGILVIRAFSVFLFMPLLTRVGLGITTQKATVLIWGGLRGAVALALALVVAQDRRVPIELGDQILFLTAGIVVLTLLINGSSMPFVLKLLGLDKLPPAKQSTVDKAKVHIRNEMDQLLPKLRENGFFQGADWDRIQRNIGMDEQPTTSVDDLGETASEEELECEFKRRLLEAERANYWLQWRKGLLGGTGTSILIDAVEKALDGVPTISPRPVLQKLWKMPRIAQWLRQFPFVKDLAVSASFDRLALGYDVARGFVYAQDACLGLIDQLAPPGVCSECVRAEILKNKSDTYEHIEQLRQSFPEVVVAIETRAASRSLLNRQRSVIDKLISTGLLDTAEADRMLESVDNQQQRLRHTPTRIKVSDPETLIRQMGWLQSVRPETVSQLLRIMDVRVYGPGEVLLETGEGEGALVIIARGAVTVKRKKSSGALTEDVLGPGSVLGVFRFISPDDQETIRAESPVEALWFDAVTTNTLYTSDPEFAKNLQRMLS